MKFCTDINSAHKTNPKDFGDSLTLGLPLNFPDSPIMYPNDFDDHLTSLAPQTCFLKRVKCLDNYWISMKFGTNIPIHF